MSKIKMAVLGAIAVLFAALGVQAVTSPAHAGGGFWNGTDCILYNGGGPGDPVKTCLEVSWDAQGDGEGVRLEKFRITTPQGCGKLENWPYANFDAIYEKLANGDNYRVWSQDYLETCTTTYDVSVTGAERGAMSLEVTMKARADNRPDDWLWWDIWMYPEGDRVWHSTHTVCFDTSAC